MVRVESSTTIRRVTGDCDVGQRKFGSSCGADIEADHPPSAIDEIAGDRASHDAKPDDFNGLVLESSFPSCRIRLTANASRALISDQTINNRQVASRSSSFRRDAAHFAF
jgi:hypothetical protein